MHETGIAMEVLRMAREAASRGSARKVTALHLTVGRWSGVEIETLRFALETLADGPDIEGCRVEIEAIEPTFRCPGCTHEFVGSSYFDPCPKCGADGSEMVAGDELNLVEIEVEDE